MKKSIELRAHRADHPCIPMANVDAADTAAQVDEAIAVHIFEQSALSMADKQRGRRIDPTRDGLQPAGRQRARIGSRNLCLQSDVGHVNTTQSAVRSD